MADGTKKLIPIQVTLDFDALLNQAVALVRAREFRDNGEPVTDRSKFIRAAIREKAATIGLKGASHAQ
jgi:hypothetical protein